MPTNGIAPAHQYCGQMAVSEGTTPTRETILLEAERCFAEHGFDGTSLNDIAEAVGIRRSSVLHHFPSKDAIYREVFERALAEVDGQGRHRHLEPSAGVAQGRLRPHRPVSGSSWSTRSSCASCAVRPSTAGSASGSTSASPCDPCSRRRCSTSTAEMDAGRYRRFDAEQLLLTGYGALLSYFSDLPFIEGLLDRDPLDLDVLEARLEHLRLFFRAALEP